MVFIDNSCLLRTYKQCKTNLLKYLLRNAKKYSKNKFLFNSKFCLRITSAGEINESSSFHTLFKRRLPKIIRKQNCIAPFKRSAINTQRGEVSILLKRPSIYNMKNNYLNKFLSTFLTNSSNSIYFEEVYLTGSAYLCYVICESLRLISQRHCKLQKGSPSKESTLSETVETCSSVKLVPLKSEEVNYSERLIPVNEFFNKNVKTINVKQPKGSLPVDQYSYHLSKRLSKEEHLQSKRPRPNYFVAVQITNTKIHENIKEIQDYILSQDSTFDECMIPIPTLHITLMVMNINNLKTYERAKKALANIHKEYNDIMCKNPLVLEFSGISHFNNKVVFGKIIENECFTRFCQLAISVEKHFAEVGIPTTDQREFNPHLTIAKMKFPKKNKKRPNKFSELLYEKCINSYLGVETIRSIQLLRMDGPKDSSGYYTGYELMFMPSSPPSFARIHEIAEKKRKIREEIAETVKACTSSSKENY